jgi:hypothetical protein
MGNGYFERRDPGLSIWPGCFGMAHFTKGVKNEMLQMITG